MEIFVVYVKYWHGLPDGKHYNYSQPILSELGIADQF